MSVKLINLNKKYKKMIRKRFNINDLFSEFNSLFNDYDSYYSTPLFVKGKKNIESGDDENGKWSKETFISDDGSYQITSIYRYSDKKPKETNDLQHQLDIAVEKQDYETAAKIRDQIKNIESNKEKIDELETQLNEAVKKQDFENAIKLRDKLKKLKS
jgi:excinuclease UvrABC helicase subunit UvrB